MNSCIWCQPTIMTLCAMQRFQYMIEILMSMSFICDCMRIRLQIKQQTIIQGQIRHEKKYRLYCHRDVDRLSMSDHVIVQGLRYRARWTSILILDSVSSKLWTLVWPAFDRQKQLVDFRIPNNNCVEVFDVSWFRHWKQHTHLTGVYKWIARRPPLKVVERLGQLRRPWPICSFSVSRYRQQQKMCSFN